MQLCVKQVSPLGVCMFSISVYICSCEQMCVCYHAVREGLLK